VTETLLLERAQTPLGEMMLVSDEQGRLRAAEWTSHAERLHRLLQRHSPGFALIPGGAHRDRFERYFAGDRSALQDVPVFTRGTGFQHAVWSALRDIQPGQTITYAALAAHIGRPRAIRAAGTANGANPINLVVPCHRVIGTDGHPTGYGGGIARKLWLLAYERDQA